MNLPLSSSIFLSSYLWKCKTHSNRPKYATRFLTRNDPETFKSDIYKKYFLQCVYVIGRT